MSSHVGSQGGEIEVSPEEERFLKRFFRRQLIPWFAVLVALVAAGAWLGRPEQDDALEARTAAALAQLRTENQRLREQVEALASRMPERADAAGGDELERRVEAAKRNVRMIEQRVSARLERRLDELEARVASAPAAPAADPPPDASAWDVSAILDRLYALEVRQDEEGTARLDRLEARVGRLEAGTGVPAAPASP